MKVLFYIAMTCLVFIFNGCISKTKSVYIPYEKTQSSVSQKQVNIEKNYKKIEKEDFTQSGIVKGSIKSMSYDAQKSLWIYEVKGLSETNGKLAFAKFYSAQKIGGIEDVIYAIIKEKKAKDIYLVEKANIKKVTKSGKIKQKTLNKKKSFHKRTKERKAPGISVPQEEVIVLD